MIRDQFLLDIHDELIVDNFAGGGGASMGIEMALGRHVDIAINHDPEAVAMHEANHPQTRHFCESVWDVKPLAVTAGRPVGLAWFSPDCKHFSKAKGGKPREKKIRGLAWVTLRWVATVRPRIIMLENVEEFLTWGPLLPDGQPCPKNRGRTFRSFVNALRRHGYEVDWRELRACDYGAPTIRKRLFLIARCDGKPIVWAAPTHGAPDSAAVKAKQRKPWRVAAECIDWSIVPKSIFERDRPLAEATMRRIARGIRRYMIESADPFIVKVNHGGNEFRGQPIGEPIQTLTGKQGFGLVAPHLSKFRTGSTGSDLREPMPTITAGPKDNPAGAAHALGLVVPTISAQGNHIGEVRAFLVKYYGNEKNGVDVRDPMHTIPCHDRIGLVTVAGVEYQITDIGMRMLEPHELYAAQGFPSTYVIAPVVNGRRMPKHAQVRMCGNSVSPPMAAALVRANVPEMAAWGRREERVEVSA